MYKNFVILILFNFIINFTINGQNTNQLPQVIPPSPNASALSKYVDIPVATSTGIPNINIPIYSISEGDITVPISLSYHSSGVKVEEISSWVGLGWSLNAGGIISRTVRMNPDDMVNGYINSFYTVDHLASLPHDVTGENDYFQLNQVKEGYRDYEPDIFTFNFGNYSGRFIYNQITNSFIQTPNSNLKIHPGYNETGQIISFIIITENGLKYHFGKSPDGRIATDSSPSSYSFSVDNNEASLGSAGPVFSYTSAWHLLLIESPLSQKSVVFNYQAQVALQKTYRTQESFISGGCSVKGFSASFSETNENTSQIQSILFSNGKIEFDLNAQGRLDYVGGKALKKINIYNSNSIIQSFELEHDYFLSSSQTDNWTTFGNQSERLHRLRLISLTEKKGVVTLPPYTFDYNLTPLPSRFSNGQDYWGYYNGKNDNESLVPKVRLEGPPSTIFAGNADRSVSSSYSQAGMLTKITYPTGGNTQFYFESNKVSDLIFRGGYLNYNLRPTITKTVGFAKSSTNLDEFGRYFKNFTINSDVSTIEPANINTFVTGCDNSNLLTNFSCDYTFQIKGVTDPNFSIVISYSSFTYFFPPGDYKIISIDNSYESNSDFGVFIDYKEYAPDGTDSPQYLVGGQRIKKIILNDGSGGTIERDYGYNYFDQSLSSGYSLATPVFVDDQFYNASCNPNQNVYKITSYSQTTGADINGSSIGYENVMELNKNLLKTQYYFNKVGDIAHYNTGRVYGNVLLPDLYANWLRGNLIRKEIFKYGENSYSLLESTDYEYEAVDRQVIPNSGVKIVMTISDGASPTYKHGFYSAITEWYRQKKEIKMNYFNNDTIVTYLSKFYNSNPLIPSKIETTTSEDSKILLSEIDYPQDRPINEPYMAELINANRIVEPIEERDYTLIDGEKKLLSTKRTVYDNFHGLYLPKTLLLAKGSRELDDRLIYKHYDNNGNPLEVSQADGPSIVYLWGYNHQYPLAKIENASYQEVATALNVTPAILDTYTETNLSAINGLRAQLPKSMVTTYTYEPLVGLKSITDPKGLKTTYEYDSSNRLEFIKDFDGNILKEHTYNYKNQ